MKAAKEFTDAYVEKYGSTPLADAAMIYPATRTALKAAGEADSTKGMDIAEQAEGRKLVHNIWGTGKFRACDHRGTTAPVSVRGTPVDELNPSEENFYQVLSRPNRSQIENAMRSCEETGCNM